MALSVVPSAKPLSQADILHTVRVRVIPDPPLLERDAAGQYLNFDFRVTNQTAERITLIRLELSVFDKAGQLASRQFLAAQGASRPGMETVPRREIDAGAEVDIFNPFHTLDPVLAIETMRFAFEFQSGQLYTTQVVVHPISYRSKTTLRVPLKDRFIVYDGHDYYSHHRRLDLSSPALKRLGLSGNPVRFALDFAPVNEAGALYPADSPTPENWFAYGVAVFAPAAGRVVSAANTVADNRIENGKLVLADARSADLKTALLGNHVVIDHGNGEYSVLAHLKAGTVVVKVDDQVRQGQSLGRIGFSGDTGSHVHLHYHLANGSEFDSAGLPAYFRDYRRIIGASSIRIGEGLLHTGDLIQTR